VFVREVLPRYAACAPPTIVRLGGLAPGEYFELTGLVG
jgi:hypothetical protein